MPAVKPALRRAYGNDSWGFAPAVADISNPTLAELSAATGFDLSCSLFTEQEGVTSTTEKITLPQLLCETVTFESNGQTTYSMADLQISFQPQAASGSDGKLAWETLTDNIEGFLWRRQDIESGTDLEEGQFVDVIPVELGVKTPTKTGNDAAGVYSFTMPASIVAAPAFNVPIGSEGS